MRKFQRKILTLLLAMTMLTGTAAHAESAAPVAENLELTTCRNTSVGGTMSAAAAEGENIRFTVTTEPTKGTLETSENGQFVYTPDENKKGRDYFGYKAVDEQGRESQEATVIIRIRRKAPTIRYEDTAGLGCDYAAGELARREIFLGAKINGSYCFSPETTVGREEFTAMCRALTDPKERTAPETAQENTPLDRKAAAVILNELLNISPVACPAAETMSGTEAEHLQAVANLTGCGILPQSGGSLSDPLSRGEAACMILRAAQILENR